ncbi:MAG: GNAT family N-acetyltransferase [Clostridia bacterium]|nr:GNAT family N-acetyltransferase [Clostridia bacterium]
MIVRRLNKDENGILDALQSLAFSFSCDTEKSGDLEEEVYGAFLDDDRTLCSAIITPEYSSYYCGKAFPAIGIGGVATLPEYRRMGCVREIFSHIFSLAPERGWAVSYLYPFSNDYYRQFGYERVMCRRKIKLPMTALKNFGRNTSAKLYQKGGVVKKSDLVAVYNAYAKNFNVMFRRDEDTDAYSDKPHKAQRFTYLWYDGENPAAYATVSCKDDVLHVRELAYTSPQSLRGILGFFRMFEGQVGEIEFEKIPDGSEVELVLSEFVDCEYETESSAMGRILLPQIILENNAYPDEHGHFRLRIDDTLDFSRGVYDVEYQHGKAQVKKLGFDADYDISLTAPPLSRILLGCGNFDARRAAYLNGVTLSGEAKDFFRAFPKRGINLLEGF